MDGHGGAALADAALPNAAPFDGKNIDEAFAIARKYDPEFQDAAEAFEEYVRDNPLECSTRAPSLIRSHPRMIHGLLSGLRGAVGGNERIEWDGVLSLGGDILERWLDRAELQPAARLLPFFRLLEDGLKRDSVDFGLKDKVRDVLERMVEAGTLEGEHAYGTDALSTSLNNLNGASFHAAYRYAAWCSRHDGGRALAPEAKRVVDGYLDGGGHTVSRHAVLGAFLPDFYCLDREWARSLLPKIRQSGKAQIAFWDGYVSGTHMHSHMFGDLWGWYDEFLNGYAGQHPVTDRLREATAGHVVLAYFYGLDYADWILERFLQGGPEAARLCAEQAAPILRGKRDDPNFDKARLAKLWRHPSLKGCNLDRWFVNTPLDGGTSVTLYRDHARQYWGRINVAYDPAYKLAEYAADFPLQVAECLEALVPRYVGSALPEKAREILGSLSESADPRIRDACGRALRHRCAEQNHPEETESDALTPPLTEEEKEAVRRFRAGDEETVTFKTPEEAIEWLRG